MNDRICKTIATAIPLALVALFTAAGAALAQDRSPDAVVTRTCGRDIQTIVKTLAAPRFTTGSSNFVTVAEQDVTVPDDPRCVRVTFSAETSCRGDALNRCYLRAIIGAANMHPQDDSIVFDGGGEPSTHAHQWVAAPGFGTHTVKIQARTGEGRTVFTIDDYTFTTAVHTF